MRKIIAVMLCVVLIVSVAIAESIDTGSMSFDSLKALKEQVDAEFFSRPEAGGRVLTPGFYTVGRDIKPGLYYAQMVEPSEDGYSVELSVYSDRTLYDNRKSIEDEISASIYSYNHVFHLAEGPVSLSLIEGNILDLSNGSIVISISKINADVYFTYEAPEGTYVPSGVYTVGDDIPAGTYTVYAGTISGGYFKLYRTEEDYKSSNSFDSYNLNVKRTVSSETIVLEEGYVVFVKEDIVMKKQTKPALNFD